MKDKYGVEVFVGAYVAYTLHPYSGAVTLGKVTEFINKDTVNISSQNATWPCKSSQFIVLNGIGSLEAWDKHLAESGI